MKTAIGGIPIFQLVIMFILIFTGIMCLTINHSKAFTVKDSIINIIQLSEHTSNKINHKDIAALLVKAGYRVTGNECPTGWKAYNREGKLIKNNKNASYCIRKVEAADAFTSDANEKCSKGTNCQMASSVYADMYYYDVMVFYQLDIPGLNQLMNFATTSSTKLMIGV